MSSYFKMQDYDIRGDEVSMRIHVGFFRKKHEDENFLIDISNIFRHIEISVTNYFQEPPPPNQLVFYTPSLRESEFGIWKCEMVCLGGGGDRRSHYVPVLI